MMQSDKDFIELLSKNECQISISGENLIRSIHENHSRRRDSNFRMVNGVIVMGLIAMFSIWWISWSVVEIEPRVSIANTNVDPVFETETWAQKDEFGDYLRRKKLAELRRSLSELRRLEEQQHKILIKERISRLAIELPNAIYEF